MSARSALTSSCLARSLAQARSCNDRKLRAAQRSLTSSQRCASSCGCSATHRAHPDSFAGASTDAAPTPPLAMTPCSHPVAIHPVYRNPESVSSDAAARRCLYKSGLHPTNERLPTVLHCAHLSMLLMERDFVGWRPVPRGGGDWPARPLRWRDPWLLPDRCGGTATARRSMDAGRRFSPARPRSAGSVRQRRRAPRHLEG